MSKMIEYNRGYRDGLRWAVTWLHARAAEMNDPQCKAWCNSAATNLGWDIKEQMDAVKGIRLVSAQAKE